jgi:hypothetical protein
MTVHKNLPVPQGIRPTLLISPMGLKILDVLFRHTEEELGQFSSALQFVQTYGLRQSKLSTLMTTLKARNLKDLRHRIQTLPQAWWKNALHYPPTRKRLTPFFQVCERYQSLDGFPHADSALAAIGKDNNLNPFPGPPQLARNA